MNEAALALKGVEQLCLSTEGQSPGLRCGVAPCDAWPQAAWHRPAAVCLLPRPWACREAEAAFGLLMPSPC